MLLSTDQELLDVVDANDKVVAVMARAEVHRRGLMHRSAHILVFRDNGEFFIQKRSIHKDNDPGLWDSSAAGHVDSGETYEHCAQRELGEELGIYQSSLERLFSLPASPASGMEHRTVYRALHNGPLTLQKEEIEQGLWVSVDEMDRRIAQNDPTMSLALKLIWARYKQFL
jgi:isopentenyldiphosphate isomerase